MPSGITSIALTFISLFEKQTRCLEWFIYCHIDFVKKQNKKQNRSYLVLMSSFHLIFFLTALYRHFIPIAFGSFHRHRGEVDTTHLWNVISRTTNSHEKTWSNQVVASDLERLSLCFFLIAMVKLNLIGNWSRLNLKGKFDGIIGTLGMIPSSISLTQSG